MLGLDPTKAVESSALLGCQPNLPERPSENVLAEPAIGFQTAFALKQPPSVRFYGYPLV